jgi:hypothetical protein
MTAEELFLKNYGNKITASESWVIRFAEEYATLKMNISDVTDKNEQKLISMIEDIISSEVYLRDVPYSMQDGDMEKDPDSIKAAAKLIVKLL